MQVELSEQDIQHLLGALNTAPVVGFQSQQLNLNLGARLTVVVQQEVMKAAVKVPEILPPNPNGTEKTGAPTSLPPRGKRK